MLLRRQAITASRQPGWNGQGVCGKIVSLATNGFRFYPKQARNKGSRHKGERRVPLSIGIPSLNSFSDVVFP
ncbi:hypothetical protein Pstr01_27250 [Pseudomonas straminea]|nr:hypothetical protein Pstr01_27250 [Pseudomonas straminea]